MLKPRYLPWSRVAAACRRLAEKNHVEMPPSLEGPVSGDPFARDEARLTALAEFLEQVAPEKQPKARQKGVHDAEAVSN